MTVLSMSMITALSPANAATAEAGDLIKMEGLSSVYYLGQDGERYVFPNEDTYFSWYSDFSSVVTIPQSELESYPLGSNVNIRPGTHLVKIITVSTVYAVEKGGTLRAIPDETTAEALYGENWAERVVDVPDAFFVNYTIDEGNEVSSDAYPQGTVVKHADSSESYYIKADGEAQPIQDETSFEANMFQWDFVVNASEDYELPTEGAEIVSANEDLIDITQGTSGEGDTTAGSGLSVALANDTPASASLPQMAAVAFAKYNLTASNDGAVEMDGLELNRIGIGNSDGLGNVYLYKGMTKLTNARTISSSDDTVTFNNVDFTVPAGETKSITVRAFTVGTTGNHGFSIAQASDVTTNGASVAGSFPMKGNLMSLTDVSAGAIQYTLRSVDSAAVKVGDTQEEVAEIKLAETSGNEGAGVYSITLTNDGSADSSDLKNFNLYRGGEKVAEVEETDSDAVQLVFDEPYNIEKSGSKVFSLKADIMGGVGTGAIEYEVDNATDIIAVGAKYGYAVGVGGVNDPSSIEVKAGELTIEIDGPSAKDVTTDAEDITLANLTFTTDGNEDVEVENLYGFIKDPNSVNSDHVDNALENIQLINEATGDIYDVSPDDNTDDAEYSFKVTNFTVPAGESNWRVEVDLVEGNVNADDDFAFKMFAGANDNGEGVEAENADGKALNDIKPGADIESNDVTAKAASLTLAAGNLADGDVVARNKDVKLAKFNLEAGQATDVKVTEVKVTGAVDNSGDDIVTSNYTLVTTDGTTLESGVSVDSGGDVTFSSLNDGAGLTIADGESVNLYVQADINSSVDTDDTMTVSLAADGITVEEADSGDSIDDGNVNGNDSAVAGRKIIFKDSGTLAVSEDNSSPSQDRILLSSSQDEELMTLKAEADYENLKITSLKLKSNSNTTNNGSIAALRLYKDGELVGSDESIPEATDKDITMAEFNNLDVVIDDSDDSLLTIEADIAGIGSGAEDTAASGDAVRLDVADITFEGVSSKNEINRDDIVTTSWDGVDDGDATITWNGKIADTSSIGSGLTITLDDGSTITAVQAATGDPVITTCDRNGNSFELPQSGSSETGTTTCGIPSKTNKVYASKVTAALSSSQPTSLSTGERELMKFTLTPDTNDSKDAQFTALDVNLASTGSSTCSDLYLYSGSNQLGTVTGVGLAEGGTQTVTVYDSSDSADDISAAGETYVIKGDVTTDGADDAVTTSINVNSGTGDVTWKDFSGGSSVSWIDLGEDSDVTTIENPISN